MQRYWSVILLVGMVTAACGAGTSDQTSATSADGDPTTTATTAAGAGDEMASDATQVRVSWICDTPLDRGGGVMLTACTAAGVDSRLTGNWLVTMRFITDDYGVRIGAIGTVSFSNGSGTWDPPEDTEYEAPIVNGKATYQGVLIGTGNYEGMQFRFRNVWDEATQSHTTTGVIEPVS